MAPSYAECVLTGIYPIGGQRGTTVTVEFRGNASDRKGGALGGLKNARAVLIDGPPGITVSDVANVSDTLVRAKLSIAADAAPGRRMVRVQSDRSGLTNACYFTVGTLPEFLESGRNNEPQQAQDVKLPVVVNGTIDQPLDVDCFRFTAKAGQKLVAAVASHDLDVRSRDRATYGFADPSLELLDEQGRVVADADDTLGMDPLVHCTIPADGVYTARVFLAGYKGFPQAAYRLTLGEVAYPIAVFPPGGRRGESVEVEFRGPNVPAGTRRTVTISRDDRCPLQYVTPADASLATHDVVFHPGDLPELIEYEPNSQREQAMAIEAPVTINAGFDEPGDEDWFRLRLAAGQKVRLDIVAQRFLRLPVDTSLEVYDDKGELVATNNEAPPTDVEFVHDFDPFDAGLTLTAKTAGDYFIRVREETGLSGPRAVYRFTVEEPGLDLKLHHWPDAVPVWGAGSTAAFICTVERYGATNELSVSIEGLPAGWQGSTSVVAAGSQIKRLFLTITAPKDAKVGDVATFRVVGRMSGGGKTVEREAHPLNLYISTDRSFCRLSHVGRAVVAEPQGPFLETDVTQLSVKQGTTVEVPVRVIGAKPDDEVRLAGNISTSSFKCNLGVPLSLQLKDGVALMPLKFDNQQPGRYSVTISWAWGGDIRGGMPAPCTPIILVDVLPK